MATYKVVRTGETLRYPDGSMRGGAGYCVDLDGAGEAHALRGQSDKLEDPAGFVSPDVVDRARATSPHPDATPPPSSKKKASKKKATKKKKKS